MLYWVLRMLGTVNKPCHVPGRSRITTLGTIFTEIPFDVSRKCVRSWSQTFFVNNIKTLAKTVSAVRPKTLRRRRKRREKRKTIAKLFALRADANKYNQCLLLELQLVRF